MAEDRFARDAWLRALQATARLAESREALPLLLDRWAVAHDDSPAFISGEVTMTYRRLAWRSNQLARWARARELESGDCVALLMGNSADYLATWIGLTRAGVTVALLNAQLTGEVLAHSINIVNPRFTITDAQHALRLAAVRNKLKTQAHYVLAESGEHAAPMESDLRALSGAPLETGEFSAPALESTALFIFTSGTTGMPKAARISHLRLLQWIHWFAGLLDITPQDRMYNCLPLYHSIGGVVAALAPLVKGASVVIKPRFSVSEFWSDIRAERCTLFQYIGELCRYLTNAPPAADDGQHALRIACGNGMRPEVWEVFQRRFAIPRIVEYYASTEGNFSLYNCEGEVGAIGRIPTYLASRIRVSLVRHDVVGGEARRDAAGRCEACGVDEVGEAIGQISDGSGTGAGGFEGYTDAVASSRKILRDVFAPGDAWYRSGDLMRRDARGFFYFVDRIGDTFRWKGENVSTTEVLAQLSAIEGVLEGVVYGVSVPGNEGRAGMAALTVDGTFGLSQAHAEVVRRLAPFARPLFVRLVQGLDATATFKPRKQDMIAAGFDPLRVKDPLFFDDPRVAAYVPIDEALFAALSAGKIRI